MYKMIFLLSLLLSWGCSELPVDPDVQSFDVIVADSLLDLENGTVSVSKHYRGHVASFVERTDGYSTNNILAEMQGFKYNIGLTVFNNGVDQTQKDAYNIGRVDFGAYCNGTNYTTLWNTIAPIRATIPPTGLSYASGIVTYASAARAYYLWGSNSTQDTSSIIYGPGKTDLQLISEPLSFRYEYQSDAAGKAMMSDVIPRVISKGGLYKQFFHWHNVTATVVENYFTRRDSLTGAADIFSGSFNTVQEYYWAREAVDSIKACGKTVRIYYSQKYPSSPYSRITTPVWIKVNLSGTQYAGNDITTSHGGKIRAMGGDVYYISYLLDFANTSAMFDITTTLTPSYINLARPNISISGNIVTTDQPCTLTIFRHLKTDPITKWTRWQKYITPATSFTMPARSASYDHIIGAITAEKQSTLSAQF